MTFYPGMKTGGGTVEMANESALGTPDTYQHQRLTATDPTFPTKTREALDVPFTGHRHWGTRENQVAYERYVEGGITIPFYLARGTSGIPTVMSQTEQHFTAAGCNIAETSGTTVAIATSVDSFTITGDASTDVGRAGLLGIGTGDNPSYYLPVLPSNFATPTVTPSMELPAATKAGYGWQVMKTMTPRVGELGAGEANSFRVINYYVHTAAQSQFVYTGCAVQSFADVVFEPGKPVEMSATYHIGDISGPDTGTIATEVFQDISKPAMLSCDGECHVNLGTFADPVTTNTRSSLIRATWTPGIGCIVKEGFGASTCLNSIGTYFSQYTGSKIVVELAMNKDYWVNWIARSAATDIYLAITQPVTSYLTNTAFGLWMPRCKIYGSPEVNLFSENTLDVKLTLEPTTPQYEADESVTSEGMAPWYFAVSGQSA